VKVGGSCPPDSVTCASPCWSKATRINRITDTYLIRDPRCPIEAANTDPINSLHQMPTPASASVGNTGSTATTGGIIRGFRVTIQDAVQTDPIGVRCEACRGRSGSPTRTPGTVEAREESTSSRVGRTRAPLGRSAEACRGRAETDLRSRTATRVAAAELDNDLEATVFRGLAGRQRERGRRSRSRRRRGWQPGHPGHSRPLVPAERVNAIVDLVPDACRHCQHALHARDSVSNPRRHQVTELPPIEAHITEYRCYRRECPGCGKRAVRRGTFPTTSCSAARSSTLCEGTGRRRALPRGVAPGAQRP
jgi:hypothetical protein